jgi:hypothetical protein
MSDFEIIKKMSDGNMDIKLAPAGNFKRAQTGKNGFGEITLAVDNNTIINLDDYYIGLFFMNKKQFDKLKADNEGMKNEQSNLRI